MLELLGLPEQASAHAAEIDRMIVLVHWLMAVLFVGWGSFFIYTLIRFRASRHPRADYGGVKSHFSTYVEVGVALVEAILLVGFAIPAWANRVDDIPNESDAVVVRVIAEQFAWNAHYPGADGVFGRTDIKLVAAENPIGLDRTDGAAKDDITTINQLNLPVNRPILIHLSSKDVIHSFGLPNFRVKQDAIPGMFTPVWFTPNRAGDYEIACSQLCGLGHYRMRGFVTIQSDEDFKKFLEENKPQ
jgi:cytochrome c oxidase subunit 2